jgi:predicted permease
MSWLLVLSSRILGLFSKRRLERELDEELRAHIEMATEENVRKGMSAEEARHAARRAFGGVEQTKEVYRERRGLPFFDTFRQDVRYAFRLLGRNPGFTTVAVMTLALGIGANTAIFSVMNATLFRPLPYKNPNQIVLVGETERDGCCWHGIIAFSVANFLDFKEQNHVFEHMAAFEGASFTLTSVDNPEYIKAGSVTADFFNVLAVQPVLGRTFLPAEEEQSGRNHVVVLSDRLWKRRFGAEPKIVGQKIYLDTNPYTVVGVMPSGFDFSIPGRYGSRDIWVPATLTRDNEKRSYHLLGVIARLKAGISVAQAQAGLEAINARIARQYPKDMDGIGVKVLSFHGETVADVRPLLLILFGTVAFVLLIACANVANLQLVRSSARQKEIAIRVALGASRGRMLRQMLTESVFLALAGGTLGVFLASAGITLLKGLGPAGLPEDSNISIDLAVLAYSLILSLFTGIAFGLAPAIQSLPAKLGESLKEGGRTSGTGDSGRRLRNLLTVSEVALSMVLLVGAGLLTRSFKTLLDVNPGFQTKNILSVPIDLPRYSYPDATKEAAFYSQILERINALPGVTAVGATNDLPLTEGEDTDTFSIDKTTPITQSENLPDAQDRVVTPDFFRVMGISLVAGRTFSNADTNSSPLVALINQSLARRFFQGDETPIGKRIKFGPPASSHPWLTIVGVVGDVRNLGLDKESKIEIYLPYQQHSALPYNPLASMQLVVRTKGDPSNLTASVIREVHNLDKDIPLPSPQPMEAVYAASMSARRFIMLLLGLFASVALMLTSVGIYGVISYSVARRTHEVGIRMALGASQREILRLILQNGLSLILIGVAAGLGGALALTRLLTGMLYGVSTTDTVTFLGVAAVLASVALFACYIPARRAMYVEPMVALRYE